MEASSDTDVQINLRQSGQRLIDPSYGSFPPEFPSRKLELNSLQLVAPVISGIGFVLFLTYSVKIPMCRIKWLLSANLRRT